MWAFIYAKYQSLGSILMTQMILQFFKILTEISTQVFYFLKLPFESCYKYTLAAMTFESVTISHRS